MHWNSTDDLAAKLAALLENQHSGLVAYLRTTLHGDVVVLTGEVGSEACRGDAKRFALAFDGVCKVRNELIVAGYLAPASDADLDAYFQAPAPTRRKRGFPAGGGAGNRSEVALPVDKVVDRENTGQPLVDVVRQPVIQSTGKFVAEGRVEISVDLLDESPNEASISIGRFPPDWKTIAVSVQLIAPWAIAVVASSSVVTLAADGTSTPASFSCLISPDFDESAAQVQVIFTHGTRICGFLSRDLVTVHHPDPDTRLAGCAAPDVAPENEVKRPAPLLPTFRLVPEASGPSLMVTVTSADRDVQTWAWRVAMPGGVSVGLGRTDLKDGTKRFSDMLLESCPDIAANRVGRVMDGIGEQLWRASPSEFREGYVKWREALGPGFPIQFITEDPYTPWEMMKPDIINATHLFVDHPVARWPAERTGLLRERLGRGDILSFVPRYPPGSGLPHAELESIWMAKTLGAVTMPARTDAFFDVLDGTHPRGVAIIHFAGHGRADTGQYDGGIELEDGYIGVVEVDQTRTVVGTECGTLMVLNACETSTGARMLGMNTGWAAALAARGFGGLVAPLWEVDDEVALEMMKAALPGLVKGRDTLGGAMMKARRAHRTTSASAFAYLAHGDVMATFPS